MDTRKCCSQIIDFIEGVLDPSEEASFREDAASCPECSSALEQYREIQKAARMESAPEPSPEVLSKISEAARKSASKPKIPFWKKWSYSPVLVPTISAAIALSVWLYYGQTGFENVDTITTREVGAAKMRTVEDQRASISDPSQEQEMEAIEELQDKESSVETAVTEEMEKPPAESRIKPASPERKEKMGNFTSEGKLEKKDVTEEDKVTFRRGDSPGNIESLETTEAKLKAVNPILPDYLGQLELAQRQQSQGDCEASIKTNELLLASSPPPPPDVQAGSYRSLAECYEKTGELGKALASYEKLGAADPSQGAFADEKISELKVQGASMDYESSDTASDPAN